MSSFVRIYLFEIENLNKMRNIKKNKMRYYYYSISMGRCFTTKRSFLNLADFGANSAMSLTLTIKSQLWFLP